jgi:hypothetical protein
LLLTEQTLLHPTSLLLISIIFLIFGLRLLVFLFDVPLKQGVGNCDELFLW